ncbi:hypothetical protein [Mycobacterium palustre]|nr:hypothetical protein [Mycobacterium palustre]MCV7100067.1 hypothetical protein [Mycobacterium palustre]
MKRQTRRVAALLLRRVADGLDRDYREERAREALAEINRSIKAATGR